MKKKPNLAIVTVDQRVLNSGYAHVAWSKPSICFKTSGQKLVVPFYPFLCTRDEHVQHVTKFKML